MRPAKQPPPAGRQTERVTVSGVRSASAAVRAAASALDVDAYVHARDLAGGEEVSVGADTPVVLASTFKIPVALEAARRFEAGVLDPDERVRVPAEGRTGGGTGLSAMSDEVELSLRDLVRLMITVSDNAATDLVMQRVGRDAVNATMRELGLERTVLEADCSGLLSRLVEQLKPTETERDRLAAGDEEVLSDIPASRWTGCDDLIAERTNRSTPREMTRLLELIWKDEAGPAEACALVRTVMGQQVWPHRLRAGFPGRVRTSGKTGTLPFIRNEVGVVEYPDGGRYAVAVFTVAHDSTLHHPDRDRLIGTLARLAVDQLRDDG